MKETKKLHRSSNRFIFGVLGGFAEYFNLDVKIVRIVTAIVMLVTTVVFHLGAMWIALYLVATFIIPAPANSWVNIFKNINGMGSSQGAKQSTDGKRRVKEIDAVEVDEKN